MVINAEYVAFLKLFCTYALLLPSPALAFHEDAVFENPQNRSLTTELKYVTSRPTVILADQVVGIQNSKLGYFQTTGIVTGITLPSDKNVVIRATMNGSVSFEGKLANNIEFETEQLLFNYSKSLQEFYWQEKSRLKIRAGNGYFCFFQAASNFGYSDDPLSIEAIESPEFHDFRHQAGIILALQSTTILTAVFSTAFEGRSAGYRETITAFAYVYINQLALDSGDTFVVAKKKSDLVVADQNGRIYNREIIIIEN